MSYFPENIMPLTPKEDDPKRSNASDNIRIVSNDYNLHDEEIRAIEEFLGAVGGFNGLGIGKKELPSLRTFQGTESLEELPSSRTSQGNMFSSVSSIIDMVNNMTEFKGQGSISGYVHSGQKIIFPENVHATFLSDIPAVSDVTLNVMSTEGFPDNGTISILNDVQQATKTRNAGQFFQTVSGGVSTVEWIRYSGKTATQFLNCERGFLNTTAGDHGGLIDPPTESFFNRNRRDFCTLIDGIGAEVCSRQFPTWRQRKRLRIPFFGIQGFKRDLVIFIRRFGAKFPLNAGRDPSVAQDVISIASSQGILTFRDGTPFLQSQSLSNRKKQQIGWLESSQYIDALLDAEIATEEQFSEDFPVGAIPVFNGRMGINYGLSAITRVTTLNMDAIQILQTADGRVYTFLVDYRNKDRTLQAISNYSCHFVSSATTSRIGVLQ